MLAASTRVLYRPRRPYWVASRTAEDRRRAGDRKWGFRGGRY